MEQSIEVIAANLREIRDSRHLSLDQLSDLTGVSKSMLRQIETGRSSPTIATIWKIANGLRVSFTALLRKPTIPADSRNISSLIPSPRRTPSEIVRPSTLDTSSTVIPKRLFIPLSSLSL